MPTATGSDLMQALVGFAALAAFLYLLLGIAEKGRSLLAKPPPPPPPPAAERFVTHAEFEAFRTELKAEIGKLDSYTRSEMGAIKKELGDRLEGLDRYTHDSFHRLAGAMQAQLLKTERLLTLEEARSGRVRAPAEPPHPETIVPPEG